MSRDVVAFQNAFSRVYRRNYAPHRHNPTVWAYRVALRYQRYLKAVQS